MGLGKKIKEKVQSAAASTLTFVEDKIAYLLALMGRPTTNFYVTWDWFETICVTEGLTTRGKNYNAEDVAGTGLSADNRFKNAVWRLDSSGVYLPRPDTGFCSTNPWVCMLPGMEHWKVAGVDTGEVDKKFGIKDASGFAEIAGGKPWDGKLKSILLNTRFIWEAYLESETINDFIMKVAEGVNDACGGFWNLKLVEDPLDASRLMVVDLRTAGSIPKPPILDMGTTNSIARTWGMDTEIDDSVKHSIMMGSNAEAGATQATEEPIKIWKLYGAKITDILYKDLGPAEKCPPESIPKEHKCEEAQGDKDGTSKQEDLQNAAIDLSDNIGDDEIDTCRSALQTYFSGDNEFYSTIGERNTIIPIGFNCTLDGISTFLWGMSFSVKQINDAKLLPEGSYWMTTGISHNVDQKDWTTDIKTRLVPAQDSIKKVSNYSIGAPTGKYTGDNVVVKT